MSNEEINNSGKYKYYSVLNGSLAVRVAPDHPDAVSRVNKKNVLVHEKSVRALFGAITGIEIKDSEYGKNLNISLDPNEDNETPIISLSLNSREGIDAMHKLPNVDLSKDVRISPYRFTPEGEAKEKSGLSIFQRDEEGKFTVKTGSHFYDGKKNTNGMPEIDWNNSSESERKIHWIKVADFLEKFTLENVIPKVQKPKESFSDKDFEYPASLTDEEIAGIPF